MLTTPDMMEEIYIMCKIVYEKIILKNLNIFIKAQEKKRKEYHLYGSSIGNSQRRLLQHKMIHILSPGRGTTKQI